VEEWRGDVKKEWIKFHTPHGVEWRLVVPSTGQILVRIVNIFDDVILKVKKGSSLKAEFLPSAIDSAKLYAERWCV
jgi:hypothetical protein